MKKVQLKLNGKDKIFAVDDINKTLLDVLREKGLKGAKWGCGEATCGACSVILDGKAVYSCILPVFMVDGKAVWTIEGLSELEDVKKIQQTLVEHGAVQCGYCIPGMVTAAKAMFDEITVPNEDDIKSHLDGNLCRCTGYEKIFEAIKATAESRKEG